MSSKVLAPLAVLALAVVGVVGIGVPGAAASDGSTPVQVSAFISNGLEAQLADLYGKNAQGKGYAFDSTTTFSDTSRVFEFAPNFRRVPPVAPSATPAATDSVVAARRINEWVTVVVLRKAVIGVARISYSTADGPRLIAFSPDTVLARALPRLAASAQLVRDPAHHAWGSVVGNIFTPIQAGTSKLTSPVALANYPAAPNPAPAGATPAVDPGVAAGAFTLVLVVVVLALVVLLPRRRRDPLA